MKATCALTLLALLVGCDLLAPTHAGAEAPSPDAAVYAAALEAAYPNARQFVLLDTGAHAQGDPLSVPSDDRAYIAELLQHENPEANAWGDQLRKRQQPFHLEGTRFADPARFLVISQAVFRQYAQRPSTPPRFLGGFYDRFPDTPGLILLKPIGYSPDSTVALVEWEMGAIYCGTEANRFVFLYREGARWVVDEITAY